MTVYRITSMRYQDIVIEGPTGVDLNALEDEWALTNAGTVIEFARWLIETKDFRQQATHNYPFNRG